MSTATFLPHARLGSYQARVDAALIVLAQQRVMQRIWSHEPGVWRPDPTEISNRLGWLHLPANMPYTLERLQALRDQVLADGFTHALLLGMGGSSLAPEVFAKTFAPTGPALALAVLDSTHPEAVLAQAQRLDPARTLFIVSTKSGGTVETFSFFKYFYNWTAAALGQEAAGAHFLAITDPGSGLADTAAAYRFRATLLNDPTIGGRYAALSLFGLAPAMLSGVDVALLLQRAQAAADACQQPTAENPGAALGVMLGELAKAGRNKVTFLLSPTIASFGDWVEQLIAESTGKEGKGILPVVGEELADPGAYGDDRVFVHLRLAADDSRDAAASALAAAGHPLIRLDLQDVYDLGAQFFLWEMATVVAGHCLDIQPFDQPDVESAKVQARKMTAAFLETGALPAPAPLLTSAQAVVFGNWDAAVSLPESPEAVLVAFLQQAQSGDYIALQAYVAPTPAVDAALAALRRQLGVRHATTTGYGPRFLHSTGQLHKGDAGQGIFLQFTDTPAQNAGIPDKAGVPDAAMSFGVLVRSQAMGDHQALVNAGRRVLRFHFSGDAAAALHHLASAIKG